MIIKKIKNKISSQKIFNFYISRYVIVGLINTVVGYIAFFLFTRILNQYVFALLLSHIVGVTNSYFWNKYFTFQKKLFTWIEIFKFIVVYILYYLFNLGLLFVFIELFGINILIAQAIALPLVTLLTFFAHKHWTFKIKHQVSL